MDAFKNYENMDNMIEYFNTHHSDKYHFQYTTPSQYVDDMNKLNHTWTVKYDDLFPYQDQPASYWTGYFSSRAGAKSQVRLGSSQLHASNVYYAAAMLDQSVNEDFVQNSLLANDKMLDELGIYQHHDAVSGTAKQAVADDYTNRLATAMKQNEAASSDLINYFLEKQTGLKSDSQWQFCDRQNGTYLDCPISRESLSEGSHIYLTVQNPSNLDQKVGMISVPNGHFEMHQYNSSSKSYVETPIDVLCYAD